MDIETSVTAVEGSLNSCICNGAWSTQLLSVEHFSFLSSAAELFFSSLTNLLIYIRDCCIFLDYFLENCVLLFVLYISGSQLFLPQRLDSYPTIRSYPV